MAIVSSTASPPTRSNPMIAEPAHTAYEINALGFDVPFSIRTGCSGPVHTEVSVPCPEVTLGGDKEILIDDREPSETPFGWAPLTGKSNQYGYHGAIFHPSEFLSSNLARQLVALAASSTLIGTRIFVITEVIDEDDPESLVGWVVLHRLKPR